MDIHERLSFFTELMYANYELSYWNYDASFRLLDTNSDFPDIIQAVNFAKPLQAHIDSGKKTPLILETNIGLVWIAAFQYDNNILQGITILGAAFTGRDTAVLLLKKLNSYDLSVKFRAIITKSIGGMPVLPSNLLAQNAAMLHYTLNHEKILANEVTYSIPERDEMYHTLDQIPDEHMGIWMAEQNLCKAFSEGDPNYLQALAKSNTLSNGIKVELGDTLRKSKNDALVLLTLCSRACITGGLNPSVAYNLNDYYAKLFEQCTALGEVNKVSSDMMKDYISRVQETKKASTISPQIQSICYHIKQHLTEPLSITDLASRVGYTEYYFSHKFKKETGYSVNEFISNEKIEKAKLLLSATNESIQDISESLAFSNRSYFYSCFQKKVGISPSEYRKQHGRL